MRSNIIILFYDFGEMALGPVLREGLYLSSVWIFRAHKKSHECFLVKTRCGIKLSKFVF